MVQKTFEVKPRRKIYSFIMKNPGLHFREISRELHVPKTTMNYHLNYLKKRGFISTESENGYTRYFISKNVGEMDKKLLSILRETVPRNIILYLSLFPGSSQADMTQFAKRWKNHPSKIGFHLSKHHTTLGFHLQKLIELDIVRSDTVGHEIKYTLKNPSDLYDLLIVYDKSILSDAFGRFLKRLDDPNPMWDRNINALFDAAYDIFPHPYHV